MRGKASFGSTCKGKGRRYWLSISSGNKSIVKNYFSITLPYWRRLATLFKLCEKEKDKPKKRERQLATERRSCHRRRVSSTQKSQPTHPTSLIAPPSRCSSPDTFCLLCSSPFQACRLLDRVLCRRQLAGLSRRSEISAAETFKVSRLFLEKNFVDSVCH